MTHHRMPDILYQKFKENLMKTDYEIEDLSYEEVELIRHPSLIRQR